MEWFILVEFGRKWRKEMIIHCISFQLHISNKYSGFLKNVQSCLRYCVLSKEFVFVWKERNNGREGIEIHALHVEVTIHKKES